MDNRFSNAISSRIVGEDAEGVHISVHENKVHAELYILVLHGIRVPELALRVQEKVKEALMDSLGLGVTAVDIFVQGIIFGQEGIFENG